jgi:2-oxoglutarate dehydrogenase complex dehydrogenase (E1) component-like enzyme
MAVMCAYQVRMWAVVPLVTGAVVLRKGYNAALISLSFARHAMLVDQNNEQVIVPLNAELGSQGKLELANSTL